MWIDNIYCFCFYDFILLFNNIYYYVIYQGILEYINNILTNGFVSSLYTDQKENLEIIQRFKDILIDSSNETTA